MKNRKQNEQEHNKSRCNQLQTNPSIPVFIAFSINHLFSFNPQIKNQKNPLTTAKDLEENQ